MTPLPPRSIPLSKTKLFFSFIGAVLFTVLGYVMFFYLADIQDRFAPWYVKGGGLLTMIIFGPFSLFHLKQLFNSEMGLVINEQGVIDRSGPNGVGLIQWKDMTDIKIFQIKSTKILVLLVSNPEFYIEHAPGTISRKLMQMNWKLSGSPINLASAGLKCSFSELETWIQEGWERYHNKTT